MASHAKLLLHTASIVRSFVQIANEATTDYEIPITSGASTGSIRVIAKRITTG